MRSCLFVLVAFCVAGCGRPNDPDSSPGLALFFFVSAGVAALGAFQERKDTMRCVGFVLFAGLMLLLGFASNRH